MLTIDDGIKYFPIDERVSKDNIVKLFPHMSEREQLEYLEMYQEVMKEKFEERKQWRYDQGDYSYVDQLIASKDQYKEDKWNARSSRSESGGSESKGIVYAVVMVIVGLFLVR